MYSIGGLFLIFHFCIAHVKGNILYCILINIVGGIKLLECTKTTRPLSENFGVVYPFSFIKGHLLH